MITIRPVQLERVAQCELSLQLVGERLRSILPSVDEDITHAGTLLLEALKSAAPPPSVIYESLARFFLIKLIQAYGRVSAAAADLPQCFSP
ncbi:MAG: hypothetical protein QNJ22_06650 [Desulfosarcinaceae bacterium]|nr:hypothetical protein [Desulfosarcinaceae bacterium]